MSETETWSYETAFSRNIGLLTAEEQDKLRNSRVAIIGMGGVGGIHLITHARTGIGAFNIADPDTFEVANFNRQYGATLRNLESRKAETMAEEARLINPELDINVFSERVAPENVDRFLDGVDVLVDGVDFFAFEARRLVFREARKRGIWAVTAGPHAFGTGWLVFSPTGMSFDEYFDIHDNMTEDEKIVAFAVGSAPSPLHLAYVDLKTYFKPETKAGASLGLACNLCAGVTAAQVIKIILGKSDLFPAPTYFQFDAYRQKLKRGRLRGGNRHPWQRLKRWWLLKEMRKAAQAKPVPRTAVSPKA